jgi:hypothetical protein
MARILLLIVLVWILYRVFKRIATDANQNSKTAKTKSAEKIVQCSACGLHVPESESHTNNNLVYCNNPECDQQK